MNTSKQRLSLLIQCIFLSCLILSSCTIQNEENFDALTGDGLRDKAYTWTASVF